MPGNGEFDVSDDSALELEDRSRSRHEKVEVVDTERVGTVCPGNLVVHFGHDHARDRNGRWNVVVDDTEAVSAVGARWTDLDECDVAANPFFRNVPRDLANVARHDVENTGLRQLRSRTDRAKPRDVEAVGMLGAQGSRKCRSDENVDVTELTPLANQGLRQRQRFAGRLAPDDMVPGLDDALQIERGCVELARHYGCCPAKAAMRPRATTGFLPSSLRFFSRTSAGRAPFHSGSSGSSGC